MDITRNLIKASYSRTDLAIPYRRPPNQAVVAKKYYLNIFVFSGFCVAIDRALEGGAH